jgi:hypothetical protein
MIRPADRARQLVALATNPAATPEEARSAAMAACKLIAKHRLLDSSGSEPAATHPMPPRSWGRQSDVEDMFRRATEHWHAAYTRPSQAPPPPEPPPPKPPWRAPNWITTCPLCEGAIPPNSEECPHCAKMRAARAAHTAGAPRPLWETPEEREERKYREGWERIWGTRTGGP